MGEHGYRAGMLLTASLAHAAIPVAADTARQHPSSRGGDRFIPVDRSYRQRGSGNSSSLSKMLASGRRRGRI